MRHPIRTLYWQDGTVVMIDQRALPGEEKWVVCSDYRQVIAAIKDLTVRGAPAIGVAAALGIALGALAIEADTPAAFRASFLEICRAFAGSRPTARNLFWAIERMKRRFVSDLDVSDGLRVQKKGALRGKMGNALFGNSFPPPESCFFTDGWASRLLAQKRRSTVAGSSPAKTAAQACSDPWKGLRAALVAEAVRICEEDIAINKRLGACGRDLIPEGARILTHCNAGALATAGYGTALGVIRAAWEAGRKLHVYIDETRPVLQGARLTAWELMKEKIPCTLITDNMAGFLMQQGKVDLVITGADRIAANGDTANKIGTYALAVLARAHKIPLYIAAPLSTIDPSLPHGGAIPIEERKADEVTRCGAAATAPKGISVWNPAFDVTPHSLIMAIITEAGLLRPPFFRKIKKLGMPANR